MSKNRKNNKGRNPNRRPVRAETAAGKTTEPEPERPLRAALAASLKSNGDLMRKLNQVDIDLSKASRGIADAVDALERLHAADAEGDSVEAYRASVRRTADKLTAVLSRDSGIELFGRPGEIAEPQTHEVIDTRDEPGAAEDTVLEVVKLGLFHRGDLLRPASVIVATGKGEPE